MACLAEEVGLDSTAPSSPATSPLLLLTLRGALPQAGPKLAPLASHQLHIPFGQEDLIRDVPQLRDRGSRTRKPKIPIRCWLCLRLVKPMSAVNRSLWDSWFCWKKTYKVCKYMLGTSATRPTNNTACIILPLHLPNTLSHCTRNFKSSSSEAQRYPPLHQFLSY